jgi:tRNA A37 threonylcarbamoyladenosine synthetase subunit TsaC/SUA5/YrdC
MAVKIQDHDVAADARRVFDVVSAGGIAIIPLDVSYAIVARTLDAVKRVYGAKQRSWNKPTGIFGNQWLHDQLHILDDRSRAMIRRITIDHDLPMAVIARYRIEHPLLSTLDPAVLANAVKGDTLNILLNAGELRTAIADLALSVPMLFVGSSANLSLGGSKYRLKDVEREVRDVADIEIDYGLSPYHNPYGRSSTMIEFPSLRVQRVGVCFDEIAAVLKEEFGEVLKPDE